MSDEQGFYSEICRDRDRLQCEVESLDKAKAEVESLRSEKEKWEPQWNQGHKILLQSNSELAEQLQQSRDQVESLQGQSVTRVEDHILLQELLKRCHARLTDPITSSSDEKIRDCLYECGKHLINRNIGTSLHRHSFPMYPDEVSRLDAKLTKAHTALQKSKECLDVIATGAFGVTVKEHAQNGLDAIKECGL